MSDVFTVWVHGMDPIVVPGVNFRTFENEVGIMAVHIMDADGKITSTFHSVLGVSKGKPVSMADTDKSRK